MIFVAEIDGVYLEALRWLEVEESVPMVNQYGIMCSVATLGDGTVGGWLLREDRCSSTRQSNFLSPSIYPSHSTFFHSLFSSILILSLIFFHHPSVLFPFFFSLSTTVWDRAGVG